MYEFLCEHIIPGCGHKERGEDQAEVLERAMEHLKVHDELEGGIDQIRDRVMSHAMIHLLR